MSDYQSLEDALEGRFGRPFKRLPAVLRERVSRAFKLIHWDSIGAAHRQILVRQWDFNHDPRFEAERQAAFDSEAKVAELERQIAELQRTNSQSAMDVISKHDRVAELRGELDALRSSEITTISGQAGGQVSTRAYSGSDGPKDEFVPRSARGIRGFKAADAPLVEEALRIIEQERVSDWNAACRVASRAKGSTGAQAREKRIAKAIKERRTLGNMSNSEKL